MIVKTININKIIPIKKNQISKSNSKLKKIQLIIYLKVLQKS